VSGYLLGEEGDGPAGSLGPLESPSRWARHTFVGSGQYLRQSSSTRQMRGALPPRHRVSALLILVAVPVLAGIIPILDVWAKDTRVGIEEHHHPGTHGFPHNHLICIQHESNLWSPSPELPSTPLVRVLEAEGVLPASDAPVRGRTFLSPRPRSPPAV
jgi:hypothetical protein